MHHQSAFDRWREIDELFLRTLDLEPGDRPAFLELECAGDDELRQAVADLLSADADSKGFLAQPAEKLVPEALAEALRREEDVAEVGELVGKRVGAYRILRHLGRGGMASVYLAERADGHFEQTVAIKFLRRGLDTEDFVRRFRAERQILSSLHHPNITRLLDGGTTDRGLPYLVLEYVDGLPITEYCDARRCTVAERLRLFLDVCRAVRHAHANLVVHRDIKPVNILVTTEGQPKLMDFGIAKLLDPDADPASAPLTRAGHRPLTPEYASPEQVLGEPITTASDVYQLGVLLYRLLTGSRPYPVTRASAALGSTFTGTQPPAPSTAVRRPEEGGGDAAALRRSTPQRLSRHLQGDLDVIVLKALRREPARRYGSVVEMADDVRRHLDGRPIVARQESRVYRAGKFLRRNPWIPPVAVGVAMLLGLYVATLVRHGQELEAQRDLARDVQRAFVGFFTAPERDGIGLGEGRRDITVREAIMQGADRIRGELANRPAARAELLGAMSEVLLDLDEGDRAGDLALEALTLERDLYGDESPQFHRTLLRVGQLASDLDSASAILERRLELSRRLYGEAHVETALSLDHLAIILERQGRLEEAIELWKAAVHIYRGADPIHPRQLAWPLGRLADGHRALGNLDDALAASREAYELMQSAFGEQHSQTAVHGVKLAGNLAAMGDFEHAERLFESSITVLDDELGATHGTTLASRNNQALLLAQLGDLQGSERLQRDILSAYRGRHGPQHLTIARTLQNLGTVLKDQGRYAEADSFTHEAYEMFRAAQGEEHYQTAFPLLTLAEIRLLQGDFVGAERVAREAERLLAATLPPGHFATAMAVCRRGRALADQGRQPEARRLLESAVAALEAGGSDVRIGRYRDECAAALGSL